MPPLYGGSEIIPQAALGDIPIVVQPFTEQVPPSWTYGTQTFTGTEAIEAAQAQLRLSELYQGGGGAGFDYDFDFGSTPSVWETGAKKYTEWYQESTPTERIVDVVGGGTADIITDVIGTDVITGSISAAGGAVADILDPITEPLGESAGKLLVPVAILGGAYLLLK